MTRFKLNHRAVLEGAETFPDGAGGTERLWRVLGELWASMEPRSGRLGTGDVSPIAVTSFKVIVRAAPVGQSNRPIPGQRFNIAGRLMAIQAVHETDSDAAYLVCYCEEETAP